MSTRSVRVFLVSGSRILRQTLGRVLRKQPGLCVIGDQQDALQGRAQVAQSECDVLVMDSGAPEWSRQDVEDLRFSLPNVKVILLNMDRNRAALLPLAQNPMAVCLLKDASVSDVITAIRIVARSEPVRPSFTQYYVSLGCFSIP